MGSAAPAAVVEQVPEMISGSRRRLRKPQPDGLRDAVLNALSGAGQRILVNLLETAEWQVEGNEVVIKVASSATVIEMSLGAGRETADDCDCQRSAGTAGESCGWCPAEWRRPRPGRYRDNGGGRGRAEQDPVVRRMKEKFGAEIRTIIDYKEKR